MPKNEQRQLVQIEVSGNFFTVSMEVEGGVDPGGNSAYPTKIVFQPEQGDTVTFSFYGTQEFAEFREGMKAVLEELDAKFGPASGYHMERTVKTVPYNALREAAVLPFKRG